MLHTAVLAASDNIEAAGFILRGIKGIFVAIGSIIAAVVCAVIAGMKGRNPFGWGGILGLFFFDPDADCHHRDPQQEVLALSGVKAREDRLHAYVPTPIDRRRRRAQPAPGFLNRQSLGESEQYVGYVDRVACQ